MRGRSRHIDVDLSPNMRVWLCSDARQEILLKLGGYDRFADKELAQKLYTHPHFTTAYKALKRRGLQNENGMLTVLGWKVACRLCPEVRSLLRKVNVTKRRKKR